ncbi:MAG: hypothetical protein JXR07_19335 [Reichenbachiella sp.]
MNRKKALLEDLKKIEERFPKLRYRWLEKSKYMAISGEIDICDFKGAYWDTFNMTIIVGKDYPHEIPLVKENGNKIPRKDDRHISEDGICCVDIHHNLLKWTNRGIRISDFISKKVYPYLANQLYYDEKGEFANGEWSHHFSGVKQFYAEELNLSDPILIIDFLERIINKNIPNRNDPCICKVTKYKKCQHKASIDFLETLKKELLQQDLESFRNELGTASTVHQ